MECDIYNAIYSYYNAGYWIEKKLQSKSSSNNKVKTSKTIISEIERLDKPYPELYDKCIKLIILKNELYELKKSISLKFTEITHELLRFNNENTDDNNKFISEVTKIKDEFCSTHDYKMELVIIEKNGLVYIVIF
jgi:hypothetical protein